MSNTYLFAGASSKTAIETAKILINQNNPVIGLSTKPENEIYTHFHQIENYENLKNGFTFLKNFQIFRTPDCQTSWGFLSGLGPPGGLMGASRS